MYSSSVSSVVQGTLYLLDPSPVRETGSLSVPYPRPGPIVPRRQDAMSN